MAGRLYFDAQWCTGCMNCREACSQYHAGCSDPSASGLIVDLDPFTGNHRFQHCRQCAQPACVQVCPENAIEFNRTTGAWLINRSKCLQCGACVTACPFHAIAFSSVLGPVKCDLCDGAPRCRDACHFDVIHYEEK